MELNPNFSARCSDDLLRDFAKTTLGMKRCRPDSLNALRTILGNQAYVDRIGGLLQMSRDWNTEIASEQTMRTLINGFAAEGLIRKERVVCGPGRVNNVAVFLGAPSNYRPYENRYIRQQRFQEDEDFRRMVVFPTDGSFDIHPDDVPY